MRSPSLERRVLTAGDTTSRGRLLGNAFTPRGGTSPQNLPVYKGKSASVDKRKHVVRGRTNIVQETCQSRGAKLFSWFMQRVTTGGHPFHTQTDWRGQSTKTGGLASKAAAGPVVRAAGWPGFEGLCLHLPWSKHGFPPALLAPNEELSVYVVTFLPPPASAASYQLLASVPLRYNLFTNFCFPPFSPFPG